MNHLELLGHAAAALQITEIKGAKHDSRIVAMLRHVGIRRGGDETPWCAAYVNWVLEQADVEGTGSAMARSFTRWGVDVEVPRQNVAPGDICVLWRKSRQSSSGHVGFFLRSERRYFWLLGGNQRNKVCAKRYPWSRLLTVRRMPGCGDG